MKRMSMVITSLMAVTLLVPTVSSANEGAQSANSASSVKEVFSSASSENRRPDVEITNPPSTKAYSPTIYYNEQPKISWYQTDPDPNTVFKTFWVLVYDETNGNQIYSSGVLPQNTSNISQSFTIPIELPRDKTLSVSVSVQDEAGNWNWGANVHYFKIQTP
ncbi:hypothetical protein QIH01_09115 [Brevibacillus brevis]|uniref:hypothetical protein n=1 Tax=Brevibacillus TaxID=55080 RepID=UPI0007D8A7FD|nr:MULTISPECIES: hypothetical protein [Brevibacillus]NQF16107.1 hypothetical protein [Brevibacillus sp. HB1.3]WGV61285.1 hypothetical protein QIH01_09115 [Brevibacillus brevis]